MSPTPRLAGWAALLCSVPLASAYGGPPQAPPLPTATPESVGLSSPRLERMGEFFRGESARQSAAGYVLLVAREGRLVYARAVGLRDRERGVPMTPDTRFRIASMTKPITAVAVLMLYEEGRLQLDDPVARYLPEFGQPRVYSGTGTDGSLASEPARRAITIRHLLTHTAGLGYGPGYDTTTPLGKAWAGLNMLAPGTLADKVRAIAALPLYSQPGDEWRYSYASDVLGRLVEVVSGMPFESFLRARLFEPLGMPHTSFHVAEAEVALLATLYRHNAQGGLEPSEYWTPAQLADPARWPSGGGGLISTAADYLRFAQMLANGGSLEGRQYLSPVTVALMTSNQVAEDAQAKYYGASWRGYGYGLGVGVAIDARSLPQAACDGDYSWGGAADTHWVASPRTGLVAVLMTQVDPRGNTSPQRTDADFRNLLYATLTRAGAQPCFAR